MPDLTRGWRLKQDLSLFSGLYEDDSTVMRLFWTSSTIRGGRLFWRSASLLISSDSEKESGVDMQPSRSLLFLKILASLLLFRAAAMAQPVTGSVTGTVSDRNGVLFPRAFVQLKDTETGAVPNTVSAADGHYEFPKTAPGKYELNINLPGMQPHRQTGITVESGAALHLGAKLEDGPSSGL
jgi:hypothetical protein